MTVYRWLLIAKVILELIVLRLFIIALIVRLKNFKHR